MKKLGVSSIVLTLIALGAGNRSWGEQIPNPRGELRVVGAKDRLMNYCRVLL